MITRTERQFEGADREHANFTIALAASLSREGYLLAKYVDDETGAVFSPQHLEQFAGDGFLSQGMCLKRVSVHAGWRIDARVYRHGEATPNTPWFYDHCCLQYYGVGPISGDDFVKIKNEWRHTRTAFGQAFHDAGERLLHIAQKVHADPERHVGTPFIDVRRSTESSDYLEFLAFAAGYWLHVFLTDAKGVKETSIITVSFSARSDDDPQHSSARRRGSVAIASVRAMNAFEPPRAPEPRPVVENGVHHRRGRVTRVDSSARSFTHTYSGITDKRPIVGQWSAIPAEASAG